MARRGTKGSKVSQPSMNQAAYVEIGSSGLRRSGGRILDESAKDLQGLKAVTAYREMEDNSIIVAVSVALLRLMLRQAQARVEAKPENANDAQAVEIADFVNGALHDMSRTFDDVRSEAWTRFGQGWAYMEAVYKVRRGDMPGTYVDERGVTRDLATSRYDDGRIGWRKIALRSQETLDRWEFDENGGIRGMWQIDPWGARRGSVLIPIEKAILFRTETVKNNPQGRSVFRAAWPIWKIVKRLMEYEAIGVSRDTNGVHIGYLPPENLASDAGVELKQLREVMEKAVTGLTAGELAGLVLPSVFDANKNQLVRLELLQNVGKRNFDVGTIIQRYEGRMALCVFAAFVLLGQQGAPGSWALSSNLSDVMLMAVNSFNELEAATFNQFAIPPLVKLNGWPAELAPQLVYSLVKRIPTLQEIVEAVSKLSGAGARIFPDDAAENKLRADVGLGPLPEDGLESLSLEPAPRNVASADDLAKMAAAAAESLLAKHQSTIEQGRAAVDRLTERIEKLRDRPAQAAAGPGGLELHLHQEGAEINVAPITKLEGKVKLEAELPAVPPATVTVNQLGGDQIEKLADAAQQLGDAARRVSDAAESIAAGTETLADATGDATTAAAEIAKTSGTPQTIVVTAAPPNVTIENKPQINIPEPKPKTITLKRDGEAIVGRVEPKEE